MYWSFIVSKSGGVYSGLLSGCFVLINFCSEASSSRSKLYLYEFLFLSHIFKTFLPVSSNTFCHIITSF